MDIAIVALLAGIFIVNLANYLENSGKAYRLKKRIKSRLNRQ